MCGSEVRNRDKAFVILRAVVVAPEVGAGPPWSQRDCSNQLLLFLLGPHIPYFSPKRRALRVRPQFVLVLVWQNTSAAERLIRPAKKGRFAGMADVTIEREIRGIRRFHRTGAHPH